MRTCRAHTRRLVMFSNKKTRNTHVQEAMNLTVSDADVASHELQTVLVDAVPSPPAARPDPTAQVLWATQAWHCVSDVAVPATAAPKPAPHSVIAAHAP